MKVARVPRKAQVSRENAKWKGQTSSSQETSKGVSDAMLLVPPLTSLPKDTCLFGVAMTPAKAKKTSWARKSFQRLFNRTREQESTLR